MKKVKIADIPYHDFMQILLELSNDLEFLGAKYASLAGKEHLTYEILLRVYNHNDKIEAHHSENMRYNFKCTKGEAFFIYSMYVERMDMLNKPMQRLIYNLHKEVI